jgi:hypothetical protein
MPSGIYHGRLATDGDGNLLAYAPDDPSIDGFPVAFHDGSYVFVQAGEPSHNQRHHQQYAVIDGTRDSESVKLAAEAVGIDPDSQQAQDMINAGGGENMHHFETQEDDPSYDPDAPNHTKPALQADALSATTSGHTDAYKGQS